MAIKHHPSLEIRAFLAFYLLEEAGRNPFPPGRLVWVSRAREAGARWHVTLLTSLVTESPCGCPKRL